MTHVIIEQFETSGVLPSTFVQDAVTYTLESSTVGLQEGQAVYRSGDGTTTTTATVSNTNGVLQLKHVRVDGVQLDEANHFPPRDGNGDAEAVEPIGLTIGLVLRDIFDNRPLTFKVDTGATFSSIEVDECEVYGVPSENESEMVVFGFKGRKYRAPVRGYQTVVTSDGTSNRPIIKIDIKHEGTTYHDIDFNLYNRDGLQTDGLVGINILELLGRMVDPTKESVDNVPGPVLFEVSRFSEDDISVVLETLKRFPSITIDQLLRRAATEQSIKTNE